MHWQKRQPRTRKAAIPAQSDDPALPAVVAINTPSDLKFSVTDCKLHIPVVTLQAEYKNKLYEELKTGTTIDIKRNKYRSQMINQPATNNLNYLIDPTFNNASRLFILDFENEADRSCFEKYYTPTVEIKDYNVIFDGIRWHYFWWNFLKYQSKTKKKLIKQLMNWLEMVILQQEIL